MLPIPPSSDGKRQLLEQLKAQAPDLLADINTLRQQFPGAKVVDLKLPDGTHYGQPAPDPAKCFEIGPQFRDPDDVKRERDRIEKLEQLRKETLARQRRKAKKKQ